MNPHSRIKKKGSTTLGAANERIYRTHIKNVDVLQHYLLIKLDHFVFSLVFIYFFPSTAVRPAVCPLELSRLFSFFALKYKAASNRKRQHSGCLGDEKCVLFFPWNRTSMGFAPAYGARSPEIAFSLSN